MYEVTGAIRSRTFRVLWMLEELGEPYKFNAAPPHSDAVLALNPAGKVPVLVTAGEVLTDSIAIIQYLADRHARFTARAGTIARAHQDGFTNFLLDEFDATLWMAARHSFILPAEKRLPEIKPSLRWEFARSQKTLVSRMPDGPFLMGEAMSVPDILLTHCLDWARGAKFPLTEPRLEAYLERMHTRPAFRRATAK